MSMGRANHPCVSQHFIFEFEQLPDQLAEKTNLHVSCFAQAVCASMPHMQNLSMSMPHHNDLKPSRTLLLTYL